jgi:hypothetical protein
LTNKQQCNLENSLRVTASMLGSEEDSKIENGKDANL